MRMRRIAALLTAAVVLGNCAGRSGEIDPSGGEVVVTVDASTSGAVVLDGEVPADFPMPVPEGGRIGDAIVTTEAGRRDFFLTIHYPADEFGTLFTTYDQWMRDAGFTVTSTEPRSGFAQIAGQGNGVTAAVMLSDNGDTVVVNLSYTE